MPLQVLRELERLGAILEACNSRDCDDVVGLSGHLTLDTDPFQNVADACSYWQCRSLDLNMFWNSLSQRLCALDLCSRSLLGYYEPFFEVFELKDASWKMYTRLGWGDLQNFPLPVA